MTNLMKKMAEVMNKVRKEAKVARRKIWWRSPMSRKNWGVLTMICMIPFIMIFAVYMIYQAIETRKLRILHNGVADSTDAFVETMSKCCKKAEEK